jgi:hypothetical protein
MSSKASLHQQQRAWAFGSGRQHDARDYLSSYELNLFQPLSENTLRAFTQGSGSELLPSGSRPAKMAALHSSSALAVNAFDYWSDKPLSHVASALGLPQTPSNFRFEAKFPTRLGGIPPNLDLAFFCPDKHVVGVESKFTEWLATKSRKEPFKPRYFPADGQLWSRAGLPGAQRLAEAMHRQQKSFLHLDAAQLLKHMLGLAVCEPRRSSLYYLYFDCPGPEASIHRGEIEEFAEIVGADMAFYWLSYQQFFDRLRTALGDEHRDYVDYMASRYCGIG